MSLLDNLVTVFGHHATNLTEVVDRHGGHITAKLDELLQRSDLGRVDTGDQLGFIVANKRAINAGITPLGSFAPNVEGGPSLGEDWMIQTLVCNGQPNKTPVFQIRTNTGRLIFAVVKEGMGNESVSGSAVLKQGEELLLETAENGIFDFTLSFLMRKYPRQEPDAGYGVSQEVFEPRARGEHETERDYLAALGQAQPHAPIQ